MIAWNPVAEDSKQDRPNGQNQIFPGRGLSSSFTRLDAPYNIKKVNNDSALAPPPLCHRFVFLPGSRRSFRSPKPEPVARKYTLAPSRGPGQKDINENGKSLSNVAVRTLATWRLSLTCILILENDLRGGLAKTGKMCWKVFHRI